jgi:hypothetical protein
MKIRQLLDGVENLEMVIPEFQREYVWPIEDAKQLMVSLFKSYPTGSLLFWETKEPPEIKNNAINIEKAGLTKVILDGQQRLTTLYLLIKGQIPPYYGEDDLLNDPRHLYFNLYSGEFQFYAKTKMENNVLWQNVTDCFDPEKIDAYDATDKYLNEKEDADFKSTVKIINNNLNKLRAIEKEEYSILTVPSSAGIDEAIDVFDRVNSKGTKLTDAELVLTHITGRWPQARREMKKKMEQFEKLNFSLHLDFLTRCMVVALTDSALFKKNAKLKYPNFTEQNYKDAWSKVNKSLDFLIPILQQEALITSTNDMNTINVLVPIVAYLIKNDNRFIEDSKRGFIGWLFLALIWQRYSSQTDQKLDKDIHLIYNNTSPIKALINEIEDWRGRIEVKSGDLEGKGSGHPLYRMLYIVTKANKAIDWSNGGSIYGTVGDYYSIQSHHIFPQSYLYKNGYESDNHIHKKKVNEIANRAFITRDTNYKILDDSPENYFPDIQKEHPGALEKQFIPMNSELWTIEKYEEFLEERRLIIAKKINEFINDFLNGKPKEDKRVEIDYKALIDKGESNFVEFKSSLRYCYREEKPMKYIEHAILKTITAFLNSEGGTLFVGVDDNGEILGLEKDFRTFGKENSSDAFLLKFDQLINTHIGPEAQANISQKIVEIEDKDIFVVSVTASPKPTFLIKDGKKEFFVRGSASSQPYDMEQAYEYISRHWS